MIKWRLHMSACLPACLAASDESKRIFLFDTGGKKEKKNQLLIYDRTTLTRTEIFMYISTHIVCELVESRCTCTITRQEKEREKMLWQFKNKFHKSLFCYEKGWTHFIGKEGEEEAEKEKLNCYEHGVRLSQNGHVRKE